MSDAKFVLVPSDLSVSNYHLPIVLPHQILCTVPEAMHRFPMNVNIYTHVNIRILHIVLNQWIILKKQVPVPATYGQPRF